jgi:hypothetical protein
MQSGQVFGHEFANEGGYKVQNPYNKFHCAYVIAVFLKRIRAPDILGFDLN